VTEPWRHTHRKTRRILRARALHPELAELDYRFQATCRSYIVTIARNVESSPQEALNEYRTRGEEFIETEIIISPRKGRYENPISHKLAVLEAERPGVWFVAAIEAQAFEQMRHQADASWNNQKEIVRTKIRAAAHVTGNAKIDDVPSNLRERIKISDRGCWLWFSPRRRNRRGYLKANERIFSQQYGKVCFRGKRWAAHRLVYTLLIGEIPEGALLRHGCDTPACVNPQHLELGIVEDNVMDMMTRGRHAWQAKARSREEKRRSYRRRKERKKSTT